MSRILILRADHLGDAILTTPLIRALAKAGHEVDFVLADAYLPLFEDNAFLHACYGLRAVAPDYPAKWLGLVKWLRWQRYDILIILRPLPRNLFAVSLLSGAKRRLMFTNSRASVLAKILLNEYLSGSTGAGDRPLSDMMLDAARHLSIATDGVETDISLREDEIARASALLKERWRQSLVVGIHPGHNSNACHPTGRIYEQICELILKRTNWRIVITGVASEQTIFGRLVSFVAGFRSHLERDGNLLSASDGGSDQKSPSLYLFGHRHPSPGLCARRPHAHGFLQGQ